MDLMTYALLKKQAESPDDTAVLKKTMSIGENGN